MEGALMTWLWWGKTEVITEKPISVSLYPKGLAWDWTWTLVIPWPVTNYRTHGEVYIHSYACTSSAILHQNNPHFMFSYCAPFKHVPLHGHIQIIFFPWTGFFTVRWSSLHAHEGDNSGWSTNRRYTHSPGMNPGVCVGTIFCTHPDQPWGHLAYYTMVIGSFPGGGKAVRVWRWPPTPI